MRQKENVLQQKINNNQSWNINTPECGKQAIWARKESKQWNLRLVGWLSQAESHCHGCFLGEKQAQGEERSGSVHKNHQNLENQLE